MEGYRKEFPVTQRYIYLDHAGVAPVSLRVRRAVEEFIKGASEDGEASYKIWMDKIKGIRERAAALIGAGSPEEIAFVKNTSHGLSLVAQGLDWREGDSVLVYEKEFPANVYPWLSLEKKGVQVRIIPSRNGRILLEDIEDLIDSRTKLLSISSVQFSNGFRIDLGIVSELCQKKGVLLCVDAIQSLGVIPIDVKTLGIHFLAADAHKWLLGPEGIGIFYCSKEVVNKLSPPLIGWKSVKNESDYDTIDFSLKEDTRRFEEGSFNVMGIYALGAAIELLLEIGVERIEKRVLDLGDTVIEEAKRRGLEVRTPEEREYRAGIVSILGNFNPKGIRERLLERKILTAARGGALRISPHFYNTGEEVIRFFKNLDEIV